MELHTQDRRRFARHRLRAVVEHDYGVGVTRDMSITGLYFDTPEELVSGQPIALRIQLAQTAGGPLSIVCHGTVIRSEPHENGNGVVVRIEHYDSIG